MIEPIADMPDGTLGFLAEVRVDVEEYKRVLIPPLEAAVEEGSVRLLFATGPEFERFDPGAMWADAKEGVSLGVRNRSAWHRFALVSDIEWMRRTMELFAWAVPGEARTFWLDDLQRAKTWVAAEAAPKTAG